jgi:signal transduction histidine kinase
MRRLLLLLIVTGTAMLASCSRENGEGGLSVLVDYFSSDVRELEGRITALRRQTESLPELFPNQQTSRLGYHSRTSNLNAPFRDPLRPDTRSILLDLGAKQRFDSVVLVPVDYNIGADTGAGYGFPVRFRVEVSDDVGFEGELRELADYTGADFPNPRRFPVVIQPVSGPVEARYVRLTATSLWSSNGRALLALSEIMVLQGGRNLAAGLPVEQLKASDSDEAPPTWGLENLVDGQSVLGLPQGNEAAPTRGFQSLPDLKYDTSRWVMVDLGRDVPVHEIRLLPANTPEFPARRGFGFPLRFRIDMAPAVDEIMATPILAADVTRRDIQSPRENPVSIPVAGTPVRFIRITATRLAPRADDFAFALSEIQIFSGGENVALGASVSAQNSLENTEWGRAFLTDGYTSQRQALPWPEHVTGLARRRDMERSIRELQQQRRGITERVLRNTVSWLAAIAVIALIAFLVHGQRSRRARRRELAALRRRLAQDIHDEIGSGLGTISLLSQMGSADEEYTERARAEFGEIASLSTAVTESLRDIVWFIRPESRTLGDLAQRLKETAASMLAGIQHTFTAGGTLQRDLPLEPKRQVLLFFKEAMHNIQRHSRATGAAIEIGGDEKHFRLTVQDNGRGFDISEPRSGAGVTGMKERAKTLGGRLTITTSPGGGVKLHLEVPWKAPRRLPAR